MLVLALAGCSKSATGSVQPPTVASSASSSAAASKSASGGVPSGRFGTALHVNDTLDTPNARLTVTATAPARAKPGVLASNLDGELVAVEVTVTVTSGSWSANPLDFEARTADGTGLQPALGDIDNGELDSTQVTAGQTIRGLVPFVVPKGQHIGTVVFGDVLGDQLANWDLIE